MKSNYVSEGKPKAHRQINASAVRRYLHTHVMTGEKVGSDAICAKYELDGIADVCELIDLVYQHGKKGEQIKKQVFQNDTRIMKALTSLSQKRTASAATATNEEQNLLGSIQRKRKEIETLELQQEEEMQKQREPKEVLQDCQKKKQEIMRVIQEQEDRLQELVQKTCRAESALQQSMSRVNNYKKKCKEINSEIAELEERLKKIKAIRVTMYAECVTPDVVIASELCKVEQSEIMQQFVNMLDPARYGEDFAQCAKAVSVEDSLMVAEILARTSKMPSERMVYWVFAKNDVVYDLLSYTEVNLLIQEK